MTTLIERLEEHIECAELMKSQLHMVHAVGSACVNTIKKGGRIFICGNGGSAADAQHFAAELVGRFEAERCPLPAIALTTDTSVISAIANDYDYENIFSRQLEGLSKAGDLVICVSTSGKSSNIKSILQNEKFSDLTKVLLTGGEPSSCLMDSTEYMIVAPSYKTATIQEMHIFILHCICSIIDSEFTDD